MGISQYLSKFALGVTPEGVLSPTYGGTGTTTGGGGGGGTSPTITSIAYVGDDTATDTAGGRTVTINGTNFNVGVNVLIGDIQVSQVTRVSSNQLTFLAPANTAGSYIAYVINTDGGVAISVPGIQYSGVPTWTTSSGSLGTANTATSFSTTVAATGDTPISYLVVSGSLPAGVNLNTSTGVISGTTPSVSSSTTYNFTIRATDPQNQETNRDFSLTVAPVIQGQSLFASPGVFSWTCPSGVNTVCVVCVGGGGSGGNGGSGQSGGGGGGALIWANDVVVTPGTNYTVQVGEGGAYAYGDGGNSSFANRFLAAGGRNGNATTNPGIGGNPLVTGTSPSYGSQGGGYGGTAGLNYGGSAGGGGAGGYAGNGGNGAQQGGTAGAGQGGGGGGGKGGSGGPGDGKGGGGVGLNGQGTSGTASDGVTGGGGGSGGSNGGQGTGGAYGGGAGYGGGSGGSGAVRIIWGPGRAFPSTNTANV